MLPEKTYILRFTHRDCSEIEEQEHTRAEDGWKAFRLFAEPESSEIYTRIQLVEHTWKTHEETQLAALEFAAGDTDEDWEDEYIPSSTAGDYSPGNPWDAPGMSIQDFL